MNNAATKQTDANNVFLRAHKAIWNSKVYAKLAAIHNKDGEQAARAYIQSWCAPGTDIDALAARLTAK